MPEVGRVSLVAMVVRSERALAAEKVITSPPARVMALVPKVVESETVRVLPAPKVRVPVPVVIVLPFTVVAMTLLKVGEAVVLTDWSNQSERVGLPERVIVLAASPVVIVKVLPTVRFSVLANVRSKAPVPVLRTEREVRESAVPPLISGAVRVLLVRVSVVVRPT